MLLLLFSSIDVAGHNDSLNHEDLEPLIPLDTFDTCYGVKAKTGFAVRYDQFAQVFFRTEVPSYNTNFVISSNVNPSLNFDIDTLHYGENEPDELLLKVDQADLDEVFQLWTTNSCGQVMLLYEVKTKVSPTSSVRVSRRLFKAIGKNLVDNNLYDILYNDSTVSFPEKLSFVQKYFFKDSLFSDYIAFDGVDTLPVNSELQSLLNDCICHTILGETEVEPFTFLPFFFFYGSPSNPPVYTRRLAPFYLIDDEKTFWDNDKSWYVHSLAHLGPARYLDNYSRGFNASGQSSELSVGSVTGGSSSPTYSSLTIRLSCTTGSLGQFCGEDCQKQVEYSVKYDSRLVSKAHLRSCPYPFCSKGSKSRAEEYAALVLTDFEGNYEILAAERAGVASEANTSFSEDWFLEISNFAADVAGILIGNFDPIGLVDSIEDILESLITTDSVIKDGSDDQDISFNLIQRNAYFLLKPNVSTELRLVSSAYSKTAGYTAWSAYAEIYSGYRMAAGMVPGVQDGWGCCSDGLSVWSVGKVIGAPINYLSYFNSVNSFFNLRSLPYNYQYADEGSSIENYDCSTEADGEIGTNFRNSTNNFDDNINKVSISHYKIFDMSGKEILREFKPTEIKSDVIGIKTPDFPGVYFVVAYHDDGSTSSSKFIVSSKTNQNVVYVQLK